MRLLVLASALFGVVVAQDTFQPLGVPFKGPVKTWSPIAAQVIFSNLTAPRGIVFDSQQNLLVVERGFGVTAFTPTGITSSPTSPSGWIRRVVIKNPNFTHGIEIDGNRLLVSTASQVLAYKYDASTRSASATPVVLVDNLPADGEINTHTLLVEKRNGQTSLLVGTGPLTNIDTTARNAASGRSQVRRFTEAPIIGPVSPSPAPFSWLSGQLVAYGIRNPAGFAFSHEPVIASLNGYPNLYIVENGASIDQVPGFTPKFANDNPADELERVGGTISNLGQYFGFPDCTTLWNPTADTTNLPQYASLPRGAQFSLNLDPIRNDAWCKDTGNNKPPSLSFQAHSVPLDIKFYGPAPTNIRSLPATWSGDAFVSFRGSFNRDPPTGYGVVRVPFPLGASESKLGYSFLIQAADLSVCPGNCIRPVGLAFGKNGQLYVSSDSTGELFVLSQSLLQPV
ncbi:hypothetical protein HGRIS_000988 [Hohenbuehelia grisea]|uniref:Pyrroloquinoline quinone-dependent pyranose dehydrogenase beta-propeller domain-containing protein n=1 Tax=Hohenbuehelia grisea TaxID=104357 RepID=A0ABR3IQC5_9AGAR